MIKFNDVTWYSKLAAIIFFLAVLPILTFNIGMQFQMVKDLNRDIAITDSILPTGSKTRSSINTSSYDGWQTYTNEVYKYSIKYPAGWYINTEDSDSPYTKRGSTSFPAVGGDTYISNYSKEALAEYREKQGDELAYPSDYMIVDYLFEKSDPNMTLNEYLESRADSGLPRATTLDTYLSATPAVRYVIKDIQGIGGNMKPNNVTVIAKNGQNIVSLGYGFKDSDRLLVPIADMIVNSFTFTK